jgi:small conductance mechanosensitive channel
MIDRIPSTWRLALVILVVALAIAMPAAAQQAGLAALMQAQPSAAPPAAAPPPEPTPQDIQALVKTLQDPVARETLIKQLNALVEVQKKAAAAAPAVPKDIVAEFIGTIADGVARLGDSLSQSWTALNDVDHITAWYKAEIADPARLHFWIRLGWKTGAVLVIAILAKFGMRRLLVRPRRAASVSGQGRLAAVLLGLLRLLLDLLPVGAFLAAAYLTLPLISGAGSDHGTIGRTTLITLALINAIAMVWGVRVVVALVLAPGLTLGEGDRLSEGGAQYLLRWIGRVFEIGIFGSVVVKAVDLVGVPEGIHSLLVRVIALIDLVLASILLLHNRRALNRWFNPPIRDGQTGSLYAFRLFYRHFTKNWPVILVLYFGAVYIVWALDLHNGFQYLLRDSVLTLVLIAVLRLAEAALKRLRRRGLTVGGHLGKRLPLLEQRANHYLPIAAFLIRTGLYLAAVLAFLDIWGIASIGLVFTGFGRRVTGAGLAITIAVMISVFGWEFLSVAIEQYLTETDADGVALPRSARTRTLLPLLRNATLIVLIIFVIVTVLTELGLNIAPLLAGAGVIGLAIGFGAQTLVKDVITGLFILFEDTISVGDTIEVDGRTGTVESISIRTIRLRDGDGAVHTVPFSSVTTVKNQSRQFANWTLNLALAHDTDVARLYEALTAIDGEIRADPTFTPLILKPLTIFGIDKLTETTMVVSGNIRTVPSAKDQVGREFNRRIKLKFAEIGIAMAVPHRVITVIDPEPAAAPKKRPTRSAKPPIVTPTT